MKKTVILAVLLFASALYGQTAYQRMEFHLQNVQGQSIAGAQVTVYNQSACGGSQTTQATLYPGAGGGSPLTQPLTTDHFGQAYAYVQAGCYTVVYSSPYTGTQTYADQTPAGGSGASGTVTASPQYQLPYFDQTGTQAHVKGDSGITTDGSGNLRPTKLNNTILIGSVGYPATNTGIQAAVNAASSGSMDGLGGTVRLPANTTIQLTAAINMATGVTLECDGLPQSCILEFPAAYTGVGINIPNGTFNATVHGILLTFPSPGIGATCLSVNGGTAPNQSQDGFITDTRCFMNYPTRYSVAAGTTCLNMSGPNVDSVALWHIDRDSFWNCATAITTTKIEQDWFTEDRIEGFTAPAVTMVQSIANTFIGLRVAGSGNTGHMVSIDSQSTKNHFEVWADSGAADVFSDSAGSNHLEAISPAGSTVTLGSGFPPNNPDLIVWNGQIADDTKTFSCAIPYQIGEATASDWCQFTGDKSITVTRIEARSDIAGSCSTPPSIQFSNGTSADNLQLVNSANTADSGTLAGNFNAGTFTINVLGGTTCTSGWQGTYVTVQYVNQLAQ